MHVIFEGLLMLQTENCQNQSMIDEATTGES